VALALAALALSVPLGSARAHGGGGELKALPRPPAPPGDGASAELILKEIEARAARDPKTAAVVKAPVETANKALERAHGARTAGDVAHARLLDGLALEWAEAARDLERAAAAEEVAQSSAKNARDVATQVERARTLLEETQARRGRAAAELTKAEADAKDAARLAAEAEQQRIEASKKGPGEKKGAKGADPKKSGDPKKGADPKKSADSKPKGKKGSP
jgi:colicin import membrane protein